MPHKLPSNKVKWTFLYLKEMLLNNKQRNKQSWASPTPRRSGKKLDEHLGLHSTVYIPNRWISYIQFQAMKIIDFK
jgi:hypothetical protein